jgi:hypothetical protein
MRFGSIGRFPQMRKESVMPTYQNGFIPLNLLTVFNTGHNSTDGDWFHALSPATYARHLALVRRAAARRASAGLPALELAISLGWSAYRPYAAQVLAEKIWGLGAATPGKSSHGGFWENQQCLAMDYGNWADVYRGCGGLDAFAADCRAVGLSPLMITKARGYPDEFWHVIDLHPWSAVPAFSDASPFPTSTITNQEDDMIVITSESHKLGALISGSSIRFLKSQTELDCAKAIARYVPGNDAQWDIWLTLVRWAEFPSTTDVWWNTTVDRGPDAKIPALQELADIKTIVGALAARSVESVADVDEAELARALAPLLASNLQVFDDQTIARFAKATADEADRRARDRLAADQ